MTKQRAWLQARSAVAADPHPSRPDGGLSPLLQRYWYTEKVDYQEVRGALRRSFSGEKVREVEAEYFQFGREIDVERCAQGIVIDLATIVDTKRDTIRQTFGNAMRLVRGISRDEEDATDPKLSLPEVYKVLQMLIPMVHVHLKEKII